ncbi:MFS general substrate transporter [Ramicandelaber brevisporus]|nr:MFS general substrate transporter [Ramicandelaber brevisporus]
MDKIQPVEESVSSYVEEKAPQLPEITRFRRIAIFSSLLIAMLVSSLDITVVTSVLPAISSDLNGLTDFAWLGTAFLLTNTAFQPLYGKFSDIFGRRAMLIFAVIVFVAGSALCGWAGTMTALIVGRGVAGLGSAGITSLITIVVSDLVPLHERAKYLTMFGAVLAISLALGPAVGGALTQTSTHGWRWIFWMNLPICGFALVIIILALHLPSSKMSMMAKLRRIDFAGTFLAVAGVTCLLLATSWGGVTYPWNSGIIIGLFSSCFVLFVLFVLVEARYAVEPMVPMRLLAIRNVALCYTAIFFLGAILLGVTYPMPIYFAVVRGDSPAKAGLCLLSLMMPLLAANVITSILIERIGRYRRVIYFGQALVLIGLIMLYKVDSKTNTGFIIGALAILGFGLGCYSQNLLIVSQASVDEDDLALVSTLYGFFQVTGSIIGLASMTAVMSGVRDFKLRQLDTPEMVLEAMNRLDKVVGLDEPYRGFVQEAFASGINSSLLVAIPFACIGFLATLGIEHKNLRRDSVPAPQVVAD